MPPSLKTLQNDFLSAWLEQNLESNFTAYIQTGGCMSQQTRLSVYQGSILAGLARALGEIYPVCRQLVGEDFFRGMAYQYVQDTPSDSPNLVDYGATFPAFVVGFKPAATLPYLSDVCQLEWAWHSAYYSINDVGLDLSTLQHLSPEQQQAMVLSLANGSTLVQSEYPIHIIWQVNQKDYSDEPVVNLEAGVVNLLVHRQDMKINIDELTLDEWLLLSVIETGISFNALCSSPVVESNHIDVVSLLPKCLSQGWLRLR